MTKLEGHALYPIAALAIATGMRRGELLGLQWGDVDGTTLRVERSVEETRAGLRVKPPKTKRGRRNIALPPYAITILRAHKVKTLELRLALGMGNITPETWIFSSIEGELLSPDNLSRDWRRIGTAREAAQGELSRLAPYQRLGAHQQGCGYSHNQSPPRAQQAERHTSMSTGTSSKGLTTAAAQALTGVLGTPVEQ